MQIFGITSLLLCVLTMFLIYIDQHVIAVWIFGIALILLILSLTLLVTEIQISAKALIELGIIESITSIFPVKLIPLIISFEVDLALNQLFIVFCITH